MQCISGMFPSDMDTSVPMSLASWVQNGPRSWKCANAPFSFALSESGLVWGATYCSEKKWHWRGGAVRIYTKGVYCVENGDFKMKFSL